MGKSKRTRQKAERSQSQRASSYARRDAHLRSLGYSSYSAYLDSAEWAALRLRFLKRSAWTCEVCGDRATQVHHRSYDPGSLRGETWSLVAICQDCHRYGEFDGNSKITSPVKVNARLARRAASFGRKLISSCRTDGCNNHRARDKELCGICERDPGRIERKREDRARKQQSFREAYRAKRQEKEEDLRLAEQHLREIATV